MAIKDYVGTISSALGIIGTIIAATIYVNSNFAQAADVKQLLENQDKQIKVQAQSQRNNLIFQLEYYDDRLRKLNEEKTRASSAPKGTTRSIQDIQSDIDDTKKRKEIIRESLIIEK